MNPAHELAKSLKCCLPKNKARAACFVSIILGLLKTSSVNLKQISLCFDSKADLDSCYRRVQRFMAQVTLDLGRIAFWVFCHFWAGNNRSFYLVMDRTNWFWGKKKINILMLSIAYEGIAIPIVWILLPKAGNSNFKEQKTLLERFIRWFGKDRIAGILADREFASGALFRWLNQEKVPFFIRIKEGSWAATQGKRLFKASKLFRCLKTKEQKLFGMCVDVFGARVFLSGARSERGELMVVASNTPKKSAIPIYLRRWEIETLFQNLKGRGFDLESTRLTQPDRIETLLGFVVIAFVWSHKIGEWKATLKPILMKRFRVACQPGAWVKQPQTSFFRYGLDHLRSLLLASKFRFSEWKKLLRLLHPDGSNLALKGVT